MRWVRLALLYWFMAVLGASGAVATPSRTPPLVIFDTDMYSDIDDMLALAMLHTLEDRDELKLLAVTVGTEARWTAPYVDLINTFYGHGDIPVGIVRGGITAQRFDEAPFANHPAAYSPNGINYTQYIAQRARAGGSAVYPHRLVDSAQAEEAVQLLRRTLAAQPDGSVVMIQVGYSTNFARLLASRPDAASALDGRALIARKVRLLSVMAGSFASIRWNGHTIRAGTTEFNIWMDVPAAQSIFSEWPTPVVASGSEIGRQMLYPQDAVDRDFAYAEDHPIAETFNYVAPFYRRASSHPERPHAHPTYDLTSVLYAARPDGGYFSLSAPGRISVLADGQSRFTAVAGGLHRVLRLSDSQRVRAQEAMRLLVSQPPARRLP